MKLLLLLFFFSGVHACGMITHQLICQLAYSRYQTGVNNRSWLDSEHGSFLAGCPFPDYFFQCGNSDAAETAHWAPYQVEWAKLLRNGGGDRERSFADGLTSHGFADDIWHGLHLVQFGYGFIRTLGGVNFDCGGQLCQEAHNRADVGGEFMAVVQWDLSFVEPSKWHVPDDFVLKSFSDMGFQIERVKLWECQGEFATASESIKVGGKEFYEHYAEGASFMQYHYSEFPFGGINDMAIWTGRMWDRFSSWVVRDPNPLPPVLGGISKRTYFPDRVPSKIEHPRREWRMPNYTGKSMAIWGSVLIAGTYGYSESGNPQIGGINFYQEGVKMGRRIPGMETYSQFGRSVILMDWNGDGVDDFIIGAPTQGWNWTSVMVVPDFQYQGRVHVFSCEGNLMETLGEEVDDLDFFGMSLGQYANKLLIVGSPYGMGAGGIPQAGKIWIFGTDGKMIAKLVGSSAYEWLGNCLEVLDGRVLVGSRVGVMSVNLSDWSDSYVWKLNDSRSEGVVSLASVGRKTYMGIPDRSEVLIVDNVDWKLLGKLVEPDSDWLGRFGQVVVADSERVVVGEPLWNWEMGRVHVYGTNVSHLVGATQGERYGDGVALNGSLLWVASPVSDSVELVRL